MNTSRRHFFGNTAIGIFGTLPFLQDFNYTQSFSNQTEVSSSYPTTKPEDHRKVVGAAHTQLEVVKELVTARPELAKSTYDWGFGDVESALGAAAHMGRKDIAEFLIEYGARPDIFTLAMLGKTDAVKSIIESMPAITKIRGPHGFTLMHHAQIRLKRNNVEGQEKETQEKLVEYLETLKDANISEPVIEMTEKEKQVYLGKYSFGGRQDEYFEATLNSRGWLFIQRGEYTGRTLKKTALHQFAPGGAPSVKVVFEVENNAAKSLSIFDPGLILKANRVG